MEQQPTNQSVNRSTASPTVQSGPAVPEGLLPRPLSPEELTRWLFGHPDFIEKIAAALNYMDQRRKSLLQYVPRFLPSVGEDDLAFRAIQLDMPRQAAEWLCYQKVFRRTKSGFVVAQEADMNRAMWSYWGEVQRVKKETAMGVSGKEIIPAGAPADLFRDLIGYQDVRRELLLYMNSPDQPNILLSGPRATGKTIIIEDWKRIPGAVLRYGRGISAPGIRELLLKDRPPIVIVDEVDALSDDAQKTLCEAAERHTIGVLHYGENRSTEIPTRFFCACNRLEDLLPEFKSRFHRISLREYTIPEFIQVATVLLTRNGLSEASARLIAEGVARKSRDIRDARRLGNAAQGPGVTQEDIRFLIDRLNQEANV